MTKTTRSTGTSQKLADGLEVHISSISLNGSPSPQQLKTWQVRFPQRELQHLPIPRQWEHGAVDQAFNRGPLSTSNLKLTHDALGRPFLKYPPNKSPATPYHHVSISHFSTESISIACVALSERPVGCDIEAEREQLRTVAHRVMRPHEGTTESSLERLCAIWCVKESMFKVFGPELDFKRDLEVKFPKMQPRDGSHMFAHGNGDVWHVQQLLALQDTSLKLWMACGPLP